MKNILKILSFLVFAYVGFAQEIKYVDEEDSVEDAAEAVEEAGINIGASDLEFQINKAVGILEVNAGKKQAFLIYISPYGVSSTLDHIYEEEFELKNNFKNENLEVTVLKEQCLLEFENGSTLDLSDYNDSYSYTVYWSGKMDDEVIVKDEIRNSTEFISKEMGVEKQSSYVKKAIQHKKELENLIRENNPSKKSKLVMDKVLQRYQTPILGIMDEFWFVQKNSNLKSMKIISKEKGIEKILALYEFNKSGQITKEKELHDQANDNTERNFYYKDNLLTRIETSYSTINVTYNADKMIFSEKSDDSWEASIFTIEKDKLLKDRFNLVKNNSDAYMNFAHKDKVEAECVHTFSNEKLFRKNCSSSHGTFPYINSYTSYQFDLENQENRVLQFKKYKVEKKGNTFEKYYSDAETEGEKDHYKLHFTVNLNDKNLISHLKFDNVVLSVEYEFYPNN